MRVPLMLDTKRFAIHDGPGIRTTFFVKGCPLKCIWCHNPESISAKRQIARFQHKCVRHAQCTMDEDTCPTRALKIYGKPWAMDDLVSKALEDRSIYESSDGGVTLSGGEVLLFWEWAYEFCARLKAEGIHTCLDTSLWAPPSVIEKLLPVTDMWLPDYKCHDSALHKRLTGVPNQLIRENLVRLVKAKAKLEVRMLRVPNVNDAPALVKAGKDYLGTIGIRDNQIVDIEYFDYARAKYLALGMPDTMPPKP